MLEKKYCEYKTSQSNSVKISVEKRKGQMNGRSYTVLARNESVYI